MAGIVEILTNFFDNWQLSSEILSITDNLDGTAKIEVCDTLFVAPCQTIEIDSESYLVTEVDGNCISIEYDTLPTGTEYKTQKIKFMSGTIFRINHEITQNINLQEPLWALMTEPFDEEVGDVMSAFEVTAKIRLFFVTTINMKDWVIENIYEEVSKPLRRLAIEFLSTNGIDRKYGVGKISDRGRLINHQDFQVYLRGTEGLNEGELDGNYSGVEITPRLPVFKSCATCKT